MTGTCKARWRCGLAALMCAMLVCSFGAEQSEQPDVGAAAQPIPPSPTSQQTDTSAPEEAQPVAELDPDDELQTLTVKIDVSDQGEDLNEPVALDLGLGFPLWLYPVG